MKLSKILTSIKCDCCGRMLPNEWDGEPNYADVVVSISQVGRWIVTDDGHHYCENCASLNDDNCWETKDGKVYSNFGESKEE